MRMIKIGTASAQRLVGADDASTLVLRYEINQQSRFADVQVSAYCRNKDDQIVAVHQWKFPGIYEDTEITLSFTESGIPLKPDRTNSRHQLFTKDETQTIRNEIERIKTDSRNLQELRKLIDKHTEMKNNEKTIKYCSFCGKDQNEVKNLISGPSVFICGECVNLCNQIISSGDKIG